MSNTYRQPCPGRIFEDLGVGFSIGCFGGSIFYFFKGKSDDSSLTGVHFFRCSLRSKKEEIYGWNDSCPK